MMETQLDLSEECRALVELLALLIVVVILGALAGADSFGETIRTGCGCLVVLILLGFAGLFLLLL